jgi:hypothetical protein
MPVDENSEVEILEWIDPHAEMCNTVTRADVWHYYEVKYSFLTSQA